MLLAGFVTSALFLVAASVLWAGLLVAVAVGEGRGDEEGVAALFDVDVPAAPFAEIIGVVPGADRGRHEARAPDTVAFAVRAVVKGIDVVTLRGMRERDAKEVREGIVGDGSGLEDEFEHFVDRGFRGVRTELTVADDLARLLPQGAATTAVQRR